MIENIALACEESGFHLPHAMAAQGVAERVNCIVLFREPGKMAAGPFPINRVSNSYVWPSIAITCSLSFATSLLQPIGVYS